MLRDTMTSTIPVAMIATTAVWTESVTMLVGVRILAAGDDAEAEQDGRQRHQHAEQAQVDLGRREQASARIRAVDPVAWSGVVPAMSVIVPSAVPML